MILRKRVSLTLKLGTVMGAVLIVVGISAQHMGWSSGAEISWLAVLIFLLTPFAGIIVAAISLALERDWRWAAVACALTALSVTGMLIALLF